MLIETDTGLALEPDIAIDPTGNAIAVWRQLASTVITPITHYAAFANRYAAGTGWSGRTQLNDTANDSFNPRVALDGNGNAFAAWDEATTGDIEGRRYDVGSGLWGILPPIASSNDALGIRIAFDANGNAIAVCQTFDTVRWSVMANVYTAGGSFAGAVDIDGSVTDAQGPQIGFDAAGNAMVVWQQNAGADQDIMVTRYIAGVGWGAALPIESNPGIANTPQIAVAAGGNAIAVWHQTGAAGNDIWANHYDAGSDTWTGPLLLETDDTAGALNPQIAGDAAGNAVVVWKQSDGTRNNILANRYVAGVGWQGAALIETDPGTAGNPSVAMDGNGNAGAVWTQFDGSFDSVYDNRYTLGSGWGSAALIESATGNSNAPRIALDSSGNGFAIWGQGGDLWVNRFQP